MHHGETGSSLSGAKQRKSNALPLCGIQHSLWQSSCLRRRDSGGMAGLLTLLRHVSKGGQTSTDRYPVRWMIHTRKDTQGESKIITLPRSSIRLQLIATASVEGRVEENLMPILSVDGACLRRKQPSWETSRGSCTHDK